MSILLLLGACGLAMRIVPEDRGLRAWFVGGLCVAISYFLFGLRGRIPDFFSIILANPLFVLGAGYFYLGARRFVGLALDLPGIGGWRGR